jgi:hypothetical protein
MVRAGCFGWKLVTLPQRSEPAHLAKLLWDRQQLERIAMVVKLADSERANIQKQLEQFDLAKAVLFLNPNLTPTARASELAMAKRQKNDWFVTELGKQRADEVILADQLHENTATEQGATQTVSRMNDTLNLSDEQQKQLLAGLVERDLNCLTQPMLAAKVSGTIQTEPPLPDISEDAEKILTPTQWQMYQDPGNTNRQKAVELEGMVKVMIGLLPASFAELFKN